MATAADTLQPRESTAPLWPRPFEYWHLLSLDAPTVSALWAWFFARAMHIALPWHAPLLLALGTWLVYVADRILDGTHPGPTAPLQQRHLFHRKHRKAFLVAAILAGSVLIWLIVTRMTANARFEDTVLFAAALLYLVLVHKPRVGAANWLPKELAVGLVFAAATAVPAWSRLARSSVTGHRAELAPAIALFAALCWLNCVAIERWESPSPTARLESPEAHPTTRWVANHFRPVAFATAALSILLAGIARLGFPSSTFSETAPLYIAGSAAALSLALIDRRIGTVSSLHLRIAADLALLTPLIVLPFLA